MKHPLTQATALKEPIALVARYRLLPLREVKRGEIAWCSIDNKVLGISTPDHPAPPPNGTTTACLSIEDYRLAAAEIAFREEQSCQ